MKVSAICMNILKQILLALVVSYVVLISFKSRRRWKDIYRQGRSLVSDLTSEKIKSLQDTAHAWLENKHMTLLVKLILSSTESHPSIYSYM